jgi:hypothetical protein
MYLDDWSPVIGQVVGGGKREHGLEGGYGTCQYGFVNAKEHPFEIVFSDKHKVSIGVIEFRIAHVLHLRIKYE